MPKTESARVRAALSAARDLSRSADARGGAAGVSRGQRLPQGTRARALAAEHFARIGFDAAAVERELAAERAQSRNRLEQLKADAVAQSGVRSGSLRHLVDAQRAALGGVIGIGPPDDAVRRPRQPGRNLGN